MEAVLRDHGGHVPAREHLVELAQKFRFVVSIN